MKATLCTLALSAVLFAGNLSAQSVFSFSGRDVFATSPAGAHLTLADVNHDGILDIIASVNGVEVWLGLGGGKFGPGVLWGETALYSDQNEVGDFNGDGKLDIFVSALPSYQAYVILGNGDGTFGAPKFTSAKGVYGMALADYNKDGKLDAAVTGPNSLTILLGNGDGTFKTGYSFSGGYNKVATADVNNDGKLDLFVTSFTGVAGFLGNGDGTFKLAGFTSITAGALAVAIADMNQDGKLDVVVSSDSQQPGTGPGQIVVLLGKGDGTVQAPVYYGSIISSYTVNIGDVNGDGHLDVISADVDVFLGDGTGAMGAQTPYFIGTAGKGAKLGDLNGDGLLDIVAVDSTSGDVSVLLNMGGGNFANTYSYPVSGATGYLTANNLGGGVNSDIAYTTTTGVSILLGTGQMAAPFKAGPTYALSSPSRIISSDWNKDGINDLMVVTSTNGAITYLKGLGHGQFAAPVTIATGLAPFTIQPADLNSDGKLDLITSSGLAFLGNGDGTFKAPVALPGTSQVNAGYAIAIGDFNKDGKTDVVIGQGNSTLQFLGNGDGTFQAGTTLLASAPDSAVAIDLNGDHYFDVVLTVLSGKSSLVDVFTGTGTGLVAGQSTTLSYATQVGVPVLVDLNGDGQRDLALPVTNAHMVSYFSGLSGVFTADSNIGTGLGPISAATGNFHGKTQPHPDIVTANSDGTISVQFNLLP